MKRLTILIFLICLAFCSCAHTGAEDTSAPENENTLTEEVTSEAIAEETTTEGITAEEITTEEITTRPVDDKIRNPLNGAVINEEYDKRVFAVAVHNTEAAMPLKGISQADVFFELLSDGYTTRGLALFSDISAVKEVGAIAGSRYMFTELSAVYNAVLCHAGGTAGVLRDMNDRGVRGINADFEAGYRDASREAKGTDWEYTLLSKGSELYKGAEQKGFALTGATDGFLFCDELSIENGESAETLEICFTLEGKTKRTIMNYEKASDRYIFSQYGKVMTDDNNGKPIGFTNVIVLFMTAYTDGAYHAYDFDGEGEGYFACGGRSVPVKWSYERGKGPFVLTRENGSPLYLEQGNTYIALCVK